MDPLERRAQILGHAARLFGENGYHETAISDIIAAAGVARGTFYLYFENKRAIFVELVDRLLADILALIKAVDTAPQAPSARQQLLDNITRVLEMFADERHMITILFKGAVGLDNEVDDKLSHFYDTLTEEMEGSLTLGQQMDLVRPCDTRIAARMALGAFKEMLHEFHYNPSRQDVEPRELASQVLDLFAKGVLADGVSIP